MRFAELGVIALAAALFLPLQPAPDDPNVQRLTIRPGQTGEFFGGEVVIGVVVVDFGGSPLRQRVTANVNVLGAPQFTLELADVGTVRTVKRLQVQLAAADTLTAVFVVRHLDPKGPPRQFPPPSVVSVSPYVILPPTAVPGSPESQSVGPKTDTDGAKHIDFWRDPIWQAVGALVAIAALVLSFLPWVSSELRASRSAVRDAEPVVIFHIGSYGGPAGDGLTLSIRASGAAQALNLRLTLPGREPMLIAARLEPSNRATLQHIPFLPHDRIREERVENAEAVLKYQDRWGHVYEQVVPLEQRLRDDGRFNIAAQEGRVVQPKLSKWALWKLRSRT